MISEIAQGLCGELLSFSFIFNKALYFIPV